MSTQTTPAAASSETAPASNRRTRRRGIARGGITLLARGEPMVWLTGGSLAVCLLMIVGLLLLVLWQGVGTFWPQPVVQVTLRDGTVQMGEITRQETFQLTGAMIDGMSPEVSEAARKRLGGQESVSADRRLFRTGNYRLTGEHFNWVSQFAIRPDGEQQPEWAVVIERVEWGRFYGFPKEFAQRHRRMVPAVEEQLASVIQFFEANSFRFSDAENARLIGWEDVERLQPALDEVKDRLKHMRARNVESFVTEYAPEEGARLDAVLEFGQVVPFEHVEAAQNVVAVQEVWEGRSEAWGKFLEFHDQARERFEEIRQLERHDIGEVNRRREGTRLAVREQELETGVPVLTQATEIGQLKVQLAALDADLERYELLLASIERSYGDDSSLNVVARKLVPALAEEIAEQRRQPAERLAQLESRIAQMPESVRQAVQQFLETAEQGAEENNRIVGRIDELKAANARLELRMETAQGQVEPLMLGDIVRAYAANQLGWSDKAGIYFSRWAEFLIDDPREANSEGGVFPAIWGTVAMTLIMSLAVVPFGILAALYLREYAKSGVIVSAVRIAINNLAGVPSIVFGVFGLGFFCYIIGVEIDKFLFAESLPNPTYGKGGLLWASLTLALMTLPVVIVATEEALSAVPNSMREGSYACGASKWQTIKRIVLPSAMPGLMTGTILAMARGAGEVAPLMLVGAVKLAPELPVDGLFPYVHGDRSFMHLGFHVYDLGFQSQNSEAAKPIVYTTTLLLIFIIAGLNLMAIWLRGRLRRRFRGSQF